MAKKTVFKEGKWRCTHIDLSGEGACNHENPGPALLCEKCNKHRPKNVQFYLPKGAKVVHDQASILDAKSGANWRCMHCNYDNKASSDICVHCDKVRDTEYEKWINLGGELSTKKYAKGQTPTGYQPKTATSFQQKSKIGKYLKIGGIVLAAVLIIWFIYAQFFKTEALKVEVAGFTWEREVVIEEKQTVTEQGWDIPSGGRQKSRVKKQHGTKEVYDHSEWEEEPIYEDVQVGTQQVECGTIDKGNGYFETQYCDEPIYESQQTGTREVERKVYRTEPVYDYWYTYEIDRWNEVRSPESSGTTKNVSWPEYNLSYNERVGDESESYTVHLKPIVESKFSQLEYDLGFSEWNKMNLGDVYIARVRKSGTVVSLNKPD